MRILLIVGAVCALFYFGLNFSIKKSTACAGISDTRACLTLNVR